MLPYLRQVKCVNYSISPNGPGLAYSDRTFKGLDFQKKKLEPHLRTASAQTLLNEAALNNRFRSVDCHRNSSLWTCTKRTELFTPERQTEHLIPQLWEKLQRLIILKLIIDS